MDSEDVTGLYIRREPPSRRGQFRDTLSSYSPLPRQIGHSACWAEDWRMPRSCSPHSPSVWNAEPAADVNRILGTVSAALGLKHLGIIVSTEVSSVGGSLRSRLVTLQCFCSCADEDVNKSPGYPDVASWYCTSQMA